MTNYTPEQRAARWRWWLPIGTALSMNVAALLFDEPLGLWAIVGVLVIGFDAIATSIRELKGAPDETP